MAKSPRGMMGTSWREVFGGWGNEAQETLSTDGYEERRLIGSIYRVNSTHQYQYIPHKNGCFLQDDSTALHAGQNML